MSYFEYPEYVPVAVRREKARKAMEKRQKKGETITPISIQGLKIAKKFWGMRWCTHFESLGDYANRLPRGRTYVRNGSVCHLAIEKALVRAVVSGSSLYKVQVRIETLQAKKWTAIKKQCTGNVQSLFDILQGKLSDGVMQVVTDAKNGLFPQAREIRFTCNCPDSARMCKHIAATLYGVGARLDEDPSLLFQLRGVDVQELITENTRTIESLGEGSTSARLDVGDGGLADLFGIDMEDSAPNKTIVKKAKSAKKSSIKKASVKKQPVKKGAVKKSILPRGRQPTAKSIAALRKKRGMNKSQFAQLLGVSATSVTRWESATGTLRLSGKVRQVLAEVRKM